MNILSLLKLGKDAKMTSEGTAYFKALSKLSESELVVGFMGGESYPEGQTVVEVATTNEFGDSDTPARPFMKQMADRNADEVQQACADMGKALSKGQSVNAALEGLGEMLEGMVKDEITYGQFAPNAPRTIAQKGSSHPLIDTGMMRQAVKSKVRPKTS